MRDVILTLFLLLTGITSIYLLTDDFQAFTAESARRHAIEENPVKLSDYQLIDANAKQINFSDLRGKTLLIDFIYTRCPTVCTLLGSSYSTLQDKIIKHSNLKNVALVSVSFDLNYDNAAALTAYQQRYTQTSQQWYMFVPKSKQQLKAMLSEFGVVVIDDLYGGFIHNSAVHITDASGNLVKVIDWQNSEELNHAITSFSK